MAWIKLDDQFPDHPKVDSLSHGAFRLHVAGMCHAGRYLSDGLIETSRVPRLIHGYRPSMLKELIDVGLWHPVEGGWEINDFVEWNKSKAWWDEKRRKDAERIAAWRAENGKEVAS